MKRTILAVSVCLSILPSGALALDWSARTTLSEAVELNDNLFMRSMLAGGTLGSYSTITANAAARTPTSTFNFDGNISYRKYWGGLDAGTPSENLAGGIRAHYETRLDNTDKGYLDVNWRRQNTQFALLGELGTTTRVTGNIDTTTVGGGFDRTLTAKDSINVSAHSTFTTYDPASAGTQFNDTTGGVTWRHRVNSLTAITASSEAEFLNYDNALNSRVMFLRETGGVDATLSPLLSFRGHAGVAYVKAENGGPASSIVPFTIGSPTSASNTSLIADMVLTYRMLKSTTFTLNAAQTIGPTLVGSLVKRTIVGAGVSQAINARSNLSFGSSVSRQTSSGTTSDFLSASITYGYLLTREWNAQLSYRYLHRFASTGAASSSLILDPLTGIPITPVNGNGPASSNSILLVVSRSVTLLPDGY